MLPTRYKSVEYKSKQVRFRETTRGINYKLRLIMVLQTTNKVKSAVCFIHTSTFSAKSVHKCMINHVGF